MIFGEKIDGINYMERTGVYAIILKDDKFAVVKIPRGYFLIGGGLKANENHEECLIRESLEEIGFNISVEGLICKGESYDYVDILDCHMHLTGYFYLAKMLEHSCEPIEKNHELLWLDKKDNYNKMFLKLQSWAVEQAISMNIYETE